MNNNQTLIDGLRKAIAFLESTPDMPALGPQWLRFYVHDKDTLKEAARHLGSFTKRFTEYYFELRKPINEALTFEVAIPRETVCQKVVTWKCPDDESLLKLVEGEAVAHE